MIAGGVTLKAGLGILQKEGSTDSALDLIPPEEYSVQDFTGGY